jgi:hypothetical protein
MEAERLAFLDDVEDDLISMKSSRPVDIDARPEAPSKSTSLLRKIGLASAALAAGTSFVAFSAGAANAGTNGAASGGYACNTPNPVPYSHYKPCAGYAGYQYDFLSQYSAGPGSQKACYVFWQTFSDLGCGADPGRQRTICA